MKPLLYILTISIFMLSGTYQLGKKWKKGKDINSYFGKIKVKALSKTQIAVKMDINSGAPSYNSGLFIDTLNYETNQAIGTTPEYDTSCKLTFDFSKKGVTVKQEADDFNHSCGFGLRVVILDYFFRKKSD